MKYARTPWFVATLVVLLVLALALGATTVRVYARTHPRHQTVTAMDFESVDLRVEPVAFEAVDGVPLSGSLLRGNPALPPVVLCHDLGQSGGSLINTAIALRKSGFTVLLFDFRGHGDSGGKRSTLGLHEKRDVLGAVEFLGQLADVDADRVGLYGVGMGAHAAVLAGADLPEVRVLVLDSLYPDASFDLLREVYVNWGFAEENLGFLPRMIFAVLNGTGIESERAEDVIGRLPGRHLLLLAPAGDSALAEAMQKMYESIPDQADADGNLVVLPATQGGGLYGDQLDRYHQRVAAFFDSRLTEG